MDKSDKNKGTYEGIIAGVRLRFVSYMSKNVHKQYSYVSLLSP